MTSDFRGHGEDGAGAPLSDEELRAIVNRALTEQDPTATDELIAIVRDRARPYLGRLCTSVGRCDKEDALSDLLEPVWKALRSVGCEEEVQHPWAYVMVTLRNSYLRVQARYEHHREEPVDPADLEVSDVISNPDAVEVEQLGLAIAAWETTLDDREQEALRVLRVEAEGIPRDEVYRRIYPDDPGARNRINKRIERGRNPGGFIHRLLRRGVL